MHWCTFQKRRWTDSTGGVQKKSFLKNFEYLQELFKIILQLHDKETPTQMFSCEYWKISKSTYLEEHLRTAASEVTLGSDCLGLSFWRIAFKTILTY